MDVRQNLFENQDLKYLDFHAKLVPNVDKNRIIGVRIPVLRKIGKNLDSNDFGWYYYEELMLHGFYIGYSKLNFNEKLILLDEFVPRINSWGICDCVCSTLKFVLNKQQDFLIYLSKFMNSENEYELRFVVVMLMDYFIDDNYVDFCVDYFSNISSDYYYVNMAVAWALSVVFVKYPQKVIKILESKCFQNLCKIELYQKFATVIVFQKKIKKKLKCIK